MKRKVVVALIATLAWITVASAQSPEPKPSPELKKLGYYIGTWNGEGQMKSSIFGPGGKFSNVTRNEWIQGNFFYMTHHEEQNPAGKFKEFSITGYEPEKKVYVKYTFNIGGRVDRSEGTLVGNTWTWSQDYNINGKVIRTRGIDTPTSDASYDFKWEVAPNGDDWTTVQEGKATKVRARGPS